MAETPPVARSAAELPPRSTHPGELYRFGVVWWQQLTLAVFFGVILLLMLTLGVESLGPLHAPVVGVIVILLAVAFLYPAWRATTSRVVITEDGVKVRNHVRSYTLSWDEIEGYQSTGYDYLRLADGRRIRLYGLSAPMGGSRRVRREGECLAAEIERHHQAPAPAAQS